MRMRTHACEHRVSQSAHIRVHVPCCVGKLSLLYAVRAEVKIEWFILVPATIQVVVARIREIDNCYEEWQ
jgi:hypothetical protein